MFDIGWSEVLVIFLVALFVIGPKEMPQALYALGVWFGKLKALGAGVQSQFHQAMEEAHIADITQQAEKRARELEKSEPPHDA